MNENDVRALIDQLLAARASVDAPIRGLTDYERHEANPAVAAAASQQRAKLVAWQGAIDQAVVGLRALLDSTWPEVPKMEIGPALGDTLDSEVEDLQAARTMFEVIDPAVNMQFHVRGSRPTQA